MRTKIRGLADYRLTPAALAKLGARAVTFSLQLKGVSLKTLLPFAPKERDARLRVQLKRQLASLVRRFPDAALRSREPKRGSRTIDYPLYEDELLPQGTEVYSRMRTVKMTPALRWRVKRPKSKA